MMRQAISTKFIGPTNYKGSRYKAVSASGHSLTLEAEYSLNLEQNHARVAEALANKLEWTGVWFGGSTKEGYCFVNAGSIDLTDEDEDEYEFMIVKPVVAVNAGSFLKGLVK